MVLFAIYISRRLNDSQFPFQINKLDKQFKKMADIKAKDLQLIEALSLVPEEQLAWFIAESKAQEYQEGEFLFKPEDSLWGTHIIIRGKLEIYFLRQQNKVTIAELPAGSITGILPFSRAQFASGYGVCLENTLILSFPQEKIKDLIHYHYELTQSLVHVMTSRVRDFTAMQQQNEKMMALGKLSAGLAHELNNPAAAIVRGSSSLKSHLQLTPDRFKRVLSIKMTPEAVDIINKKITNAIAISERPTLTMMQRTAKEEELEDWLFDYGIKDGVDIAENFVEFGLTIDDLEQFKTEIREEDLEAVFLWINSNFVTERMVADIQESSKRIADLVGSVKTFTHMDGGGDKQFTNIHTGIRNTLVMLNHKIKKANIKVVEHFNEQIPLVKVMVGELNQVWTNLIDNATDVLDGVADATLTIATQLEKGFIKVNIIDNGPGIPPDVKSKIFDPFFTTKEIGKGTGLGLDVVTRIVKQHNGSIKVDSVKGKTNFEVCFPANF